VELRQELAARHAMPRNSQSYLERKPPCLSCDATSAVHRRNKSPSALSRAPDPVHVRARLRQQKLRQNNLEARRVVRSTDTTHGQPSSSQPIQAANPRLHHPARPSFWSGTSPVSQVQPTLVGRSVMEDSMEARCRTGEQAPTLPGLACNIGPRHEGGHCCSAISCCPNHWASRNYRLGPCGLDARTRKMTSACQWPSVEVDAREEKVRDDWGILRAAYATEGADN
jgi:hypothetical protein